MHMYLNWQHPRWLAFFSTFLMVGVAAAASEFPGPQWTTASPADVGLDAARLTEARDYALTGGGSGCIIRHGRLAMTWGDQGKLYDLKSSTKSFGSAALGLAIKDGKLHLTDKARGLHPELGTQPPENLKSGWLDMVTIEHLASQTAGFEKPGGFTPLLFQPGTQWDYSDSGPNWLAECITLAYGRDLDALMFERVFTPLGIDRKDLVWRKNAYRPETIAGIGRREFGSGISANVDAMARFGYLWLHEGEWDGREILPRSFVDKVRTTAAWVKVLPVHKSEDYGDAARHYGLLWWNNGDGSIAEVPRDTYWSWGLYDSVIVVMPSLDMVIARAGQSWKRTPNAPHYDVLKPFFLPIIAAAAADARPSPGGATAAPPYPPSPVIRQITWAPPKDIIRLARGSDNWPATWADDDALYTAYGDGQGFLPISGGKLSMGLARITGIPPTVSGSNIRSSTAESRGDGKQGSKASGMLCLDDILYMLRRNCANSQLGWSADHGTTWQWANWRFSESFGCPTFLNFGKNNAGCRDDFVYLYSPDSDSAYERADRFVLARVPKNKLRDRAAYEFFVSVDAAGAPQWSQDIKQRGGVFVDTGNCYRSSVSYNPALRRYLLCNIGPGSDTRFSGGLGIYDAPEPWGPWTTVFYTEKWDVGPGETASFPTKWMSNDGSTMELLFSGDDSFSVRRATLTLNTPPQKAPAHSDRLRIIVETDAGGDPDDEQSLVRFLLYASEFDIEGIIANRPVARSGENANAVRDGLGIVQAQITAYGQCYSSLVQHNPRFPKPEDLMAKAVAGYADTDDGVELIIRAVDSPDPRPIWFCNWGTDNGSSESSLKRALDRILQERGQAGYAAFKNRLRLSSADKFAEHTTKLQPAFPLWIDTFNPPIGKKRWYQRFSPLTAKAGGMNLERDVRSGHGPLGALYPTNSNIPQKEGDSMTFLYLLPTGMNDPNQPTWGSWGGRYGRNSELPDAPYYWANLSDRWQETDDRDNTLGRWAADLQNDFRARLDWCVKPFSQANHPPQAMVNGNPGKEILCVEATSGNKVQLDAAGSTDPDGNPLTYTWLIYPEAGTFVGTVPLDTATGTKSALRAPTVTDPVTIHVLLRVADNGAPPLCAYRRIIVTVTP